ncbi:MAG TPA: class II glutamine amidotransferase [Lacipirellulaceae bacterium]|nr:class II glutamine amidotransferase [Lacipirellulaceae bacterium]
MVTRHRCFCVALIVLVGLTVTIPKTVTAQATQNANAAATAGASGQLKTMAVVAGAPYDKLLSDLKYLGPMVGQPAAGQLADALLAQFTMGKSATALDKSKAWGLIVQTDGAGFYPVICLPLAKLEDVVAVAKAHQIEVKDGENGSTELVLPNGQSLFTKSQNDMVFISRAPASLAHLPNNAQEILKNRVGEYDLTVALSVKDVPEMWRQMAIGTLQMTVQQGMQKQADETDQQFAARQHSTQAKVDQLKQMINEIDSLKIGWAVDAQQKRTYLDFTYAFVPGSKMADQAAAYSNPQTNFAGFYQSDAAAALSFASHADPKLIAADMAQYESMMRDQREALNQQIEKNVGDSEIREAVKSAVGDVFDAVEATIKEGHIDGGASLHLSPGSMTLVAGTHVKEPSKIESALKKLETAAKKSPEFTGVKWNAGSHAGVTFHTFTIPVPKDKQEQRRVFGDEVKIAVGVGPEAVYLGVGRDSMEAIGKAIDSSAASPNKKVPPFELTLSLRPIMEFAASVQQGREQQISQTLAETLKNESPGRDHVRVIGQLIPNGLRYRIEAEDGVIRLIGVAASQARQANSGGANP